MVQLVLILPGSTDYDAQHRIQGNLDVPLNEQGEAEVVRMIEELRGLNIDALYAACGEPSTQTAEKIAEALDLKLRKMDRMQNLNMGLWQGMLIEEVRLRQPKVYRQWQERPENVCPPEGEMLADANERVESTMTKILKRHKEGTVAIVVPEPLAGLVRRFVTHEEIGDLWKALGEHARWEIIGAQPHALAHTE